jgi:conjugative relaxase-like TrwC/TraI family protein
MIRMIQSTSSKQAKAYFSNALDKADYYINDVELQGKFFGKLCDRLGISSTATKEVFFALCENRHPVTKEKLTPRNKAGRTTGYDISFHAPKSVSIGHVFSEDNRILQAFETSVRETMKELEQAAKTRIRKNGAYDDRATGELIWAEFIHQTSRSAGDGITPDMHLHSHNYVFNLSFDETENRFKAAKFREVMQSMPYYQAAFHKRLADELVKKGYAIRKTDHSFELEGVEEKLIRHFSKRTDQIGKVAKEKNITDSKALAELGAKTRARKQKGLSMQDLRDDWKHQIAQLTQPETGKEFEKAPEPTRISLPDLTVKPKAEKPNLKTAQACLNHALQHCFERASVVPSTQLMAEAYRYGLGSPEVSVSAIRAAFEADDRLISIKRGTRILCTTKEVLKEEKRMVDLAREGMGKITPIYTNAPTIDNVNEQQKQAIAHVLTTSSRVSIIRGAAGTGKTTLMKEAKRWIEASGKSIIAVAPTAEASRGVLRQDGFNDAETVAKLLTDSKLQEQLKGQVLWVDEAGLLSTQQAVKLLELARKHNARLVLSGDTKQHRAIERGDAMRILSTVGHIHPAEVRLIQRQKNALYRDAVNDLSNGLVADAFQKLDVMGAVKTYDRDNPHEKLVKDYLKAIQRRKSALVISPTHKEGKAVTEKLRESLRKVRKLGKKELHVRQLVNLSFTEAEKADTRNYEKGHVVQFTQHDKGIPRGSQWIVHKIEQDDVYLRNSAGHTITLPRTHAKRFDVFEQTKIPLSKGDQVRITRNGFDKKNKRLDNGTTLKVKSIALDGSLVLHNPVSKKTFHLDSTYGHLDHAYCITSHAAQGKTVDEVFIAQPATTFGATDMKQFCVSVSRGKEAVHLYTDDRTLLLEHASELGDRPSALELVSQTATKTKDYTEYRRKQEYQPLKEKGGTGRKQDFTRNAKDFDYEPGI